MARGRCTSAPEPVLRAIGKKPMLATMAVIKTGRRRSSVPCLIRAYISPTPSCSSLLNVPTRTIPFNTATPKSAIKPIPALILKGKPHTSKANTPPIALIGIAVKIKLACLSEENVKYRSANIKNSEIGTAIISLRLAASRFSN